MQNGSGRATGVRKAFSGYGVQPPCTDLIEVTVSVRWLCADVWLLVVPLVLRDVLPAPAEVLAPAVVLPAPAVVWPPAMGLPPLLLMPLSGDSDPTISTH